MRNFTPAYITSSILRFSGSNRRFSRPASGALYPPRAAVAAGGSRSSGSAPARAPGRPRTFRKWTARRLSWRAWRPHTLRKLGQHMQSGVARNVVADEFHGLFVQEGFHSRIIILFSARILAPFAAKTPFRSHFAERAAHLSGTRCIPCCGSGGGV